MHRSATGPGALSGVLLAWVAVVGCDPGPLGPSDDGLLLHTDRSRYVAEVVALNGNYTQYGFTVVTRFRNTTDGNLYLGRCYPDTPIPHYDVESVGSRNGGAAYSPFWACVWHAAQFRIEPGQTRVDTIRVRGPNFWDGITKEPLGAMEGWFRLSYDVRYCPGECADEAPKRLRVSNLFEVTRPGSS